MRAVTFSPTGAGSTWFYLASIAVAAGAALVGPVVLFGEGSGHAGVLGFFLGLGLLLVGPAPALIGALKAVRAEQPARPRQLAAVGVATTVYVVAIVAALMGFADWAALVGITSVAVLGPMATSARHRFAAVVFGVVAIASLALLIAALWLFA